MATKRLPKKLPSQQELWDKFDYNPGTGILTRKELDRKYFKSDKGWKMYNGKHAGKEAGALKPTGYVEVRINQQGIYKAHRVIWKWMTGEEPGLEIDHKNGNRADNRFENLESHDVYGMNNLNAAKYSNNRSGHVGVHQLPSGSWMAIGSCEGKTVYLGVQKDYDTAVKVRQEWQDAQGLFSQRHGS